MNYVYILRCADDSLYTGWTNNLTARLAAHNSGHGAKYTKGRSPVSLVYSEAFTTKSAALRQESRLKRLTREQKLRLIAEQTEPGEYLTIYDADGNACGERPRSLVHAQGLRHHVVHLWVLTGNQLWLQQRALDRPLYPGQFDLAATGHIDPDETPADAVCREAQEEVGLSLSPTDLIPLPQTAQQFPRPDGFDDEVVFPFLFRSEGPLMWNPGSEVSRMVPVLLTDYEAAVHAFSAGNPPVSVRLGEEIVTSDRMCCLHPVEWLACRSFICP